ncbi:hypothetical protein DP939_40930 [Spongiactinospora rosea]|uniref:Uncharacterized protein n=1 Tax=Spongiactinospora rosea TaxID=2248750 RepID=A0A366LK90_9ACTN|nr:hypothetical protein DP939_40930 [Spongiactinospora rosea]
MSPAAVTVAPSAVLVADPEERQPGVPHTSPAGEEAVQGVEHGLLVGVRIVGDTVEVVRLGHDDE